MDLGIFGRVAFVSGSSSGMGRTTAELLAAEGCKVAVAALERDKGAIDETVAGIIAAGGQAVGVAGDLTLRDDVERVIGEVRETLGPPDIAVVNVDGPPPGYFDEVSDDAFTLASQQMTMSMVYMARAVLPHMKEQGWGRIVTLNSVGAKEPPGDIGHALVNPSRAAVVALNKTLSNEFARFGITINTLGTGWIGTDRMFRFVDMEAERKQVSREQALAELAAAFPANRIGKPEEMAATVAFLCSEGGGYINGEFINVDGGWHRSAF